MTAARVEPIDTNVGEPDSCERGYLHLTPTGWVRADVAPFPAHRVETWYLEVERPAEDAKERDCLTRVWISEDVSEEQRNALRAKFGDPVLPSVTRTLNMRCDV